MVVCVREREEAAQISKPGIMKKRDWSFKEPFRPIHTTKPDYIFKGCHGAAVALHETRLSLLHTCTFLLRGRLRTFCRPSNVVLLPHILHRRKNFHVVLSHALCLNSFPLQSAIKAFLVLSRLFFKSLSWPRLSPRRRAESLR